MIVFDAAGIVALSTLITAVAALVWACRKHPRNPGK